jgi:hypothetical protein
LVNSLMPLDSNDSDTNSIPFNFAGDDDPIDDVTYVDKFSSIPDIISDDKDIHSDDNLELFTKISSIEKTINIYKESIQQKNIYSSLIFHEYNSKMSHYYSSEQNHSCAGMKHVIAQSYRSTEIEHKIGMEELRFQTLNAKFVMNLTRKQQLEYSNLLDSMNNLFINPTQPDSFTIQCELPIEHRDMRRLILDGKYSILKNIPIPEFTMLKQYSYASVTDCIADFLLQSNTCLQNSENNNYPSYPNESIFNSKICNKFLLTLVKD